MRVSFLLLLSLTPGIAQITPPGNVKVPAGEQPSKPFVWSERRLLTAPELFDAPDDWIDRWLQWVDFILDTYKPAIPEHPLRRATQAGGAEVLCGANAQSN